MPGEKPPAIGACDVVGGKKQTHAADTNEDAEHLGPVVADFQQCEREDYHDDYCPEVDICSRLSAFSLPPSARRISNGNLHFHPSFNTICPHFLNPYL